MVEKLLTNRKRVFWEALFLTVVVFLFGLLIGISFESNKLDEINNYYISSETSIMDAFALNSFADLDYESCDALINANVDFANNVYEEALILEKYENAGKVTESMEIMHKKYDVLRTFLWLNTIKTAERCGRKYDTVVYLYESNTEDLTQRAVQNVWSKILGDLKKEYGSKIILIPLAVDNNLVSLDSLLKNFDVENYPAIIINEKFVISELTSVDDLRVYLDDNQSIQ